MSLDKLTPNDSRFTKESAEVNGKRWYYLDAPPKGKQTGTVVLVHGFPDLPYTWRYQIPMLNELGLRCIALECQGYGDTGASEDLKDYSFKSHADAIAGICEKIGANNIIIGGHDWGGAVIFRVAQWYPDLVTHVFSVCTPYFKVSDTYVSTETLANGPVPQFGYQLQFGSEDQKVEKVVNNEEKLRKFLSGLYGGRPQSGKKFMTPEKGIDLSIIENEEVDPTKLMSSEDFEHYVKEFSKNGVHGPCNWYRTRKVNFEEELHMPATVKDGIKQPTLWVYATLDSILTEELARSMFNVIPNLTRRDVPASHWALWHTPKETNEAIKSWFEGVVFGGKSKL